MYSGAGRQSGPYLPSIPNNDGPKGSSFGFQPMTERRLTRAEGC